jgi:RHS repeat-associated protein
LSSSAGDFVVGASASLTATTDTDVAGSGYHTTIWDMTTGAKLKDCTSGSTCAVAGVSFASGGPHSYRAYVSATASVSAFTQPLLTSSTVAVARAPWTVSLASDRTETVAGQSVTLTATANQDVGGTGGAYKISILDQTAHTTLKVCTTGTTCAVSNTFTGNQLHSFLAQVDNGAAGDVQAISAPAPVARSAWSVSLTSDKGVYSGGDTVVLTATPSADVGATGGTYQVVIINQGTSSVIGACATLTAGACVANATFVAGSPQTYIAEVAQYAAGTVSDVQATSNALNTGAAAWQVSLTSDATVLPAGGTIHFTATANQSVTGSGYVIAIIDLTSGVGLGYCTTGSTCTGTLTSLQFNTGLAHTIFAYVDTATYAPPTNVQAASGSILITRQEWSLRLTIDRTMFSTTDSVTLTATANQDVGQTNSAYKIYFWDLTDHYQVGNGCNTGTVCTFTFTNLTARQWTGGPHLFMAYVAASSSPSGLTDVQTSSATVKLTRRPWELIIRPLPGGGLTAFANQDVGYTAGWWKIDIYDDTYHSQIIRCSVGSTCTTNPFSLGTDHYIAYIDDGNGPYATNANIAATSDGFSAPTNGMALAHETNAGGNPSETTTSCQCADPVDPATGEFHLTGQDLSLPGRLPFTLARTYSSARAGQLGLFGYGWSSPLDMRANEPVGSTQAQSQPTEVVQENGSSVWFDPVPTGDPNAYPTNFTAGPQVHASLREDWTQSAFIFTRGDGITFTLGGLYAGVSAISDTNGNTTTVNATTSSVVVTTADGRTLTLTLNPDGTAASAAGPEGRTVSYGYDATKNLASVTDSRGNVWRFSYDGSHRMTGVQSPVQYAASAQVINHYDANGRVDWQSVPINPTTGQTTPTSGTTNFSYSTNALGQSRTRVTDPDGVITDYTYILGRLSSKTLNPTGATPATTQYSYDDQGDRTQTVDPTLVVTLGSYDTRGNQLTAVDSAGNLTSWSYNSLNEPLTQTWTDAAGPHTLNSTYDNHGNLTDRAVPLDASTTASTHYTYGDASHTDDITKITDPRSNDTLLSWTTEGFLKDSTAPDGGKTSWTYNAYGDVKTQVSPLGNCSGCTPASYTTTTAYYTHSSLPQTVTDPESKTVSYGYDDDGRQTTTTDGYSKTSTTTYWLDGAPKSSQDPLGHTTSIDETAGGRESVLTAADGATTTQSYDAYGRLWKVIKPTGNVTGLTQAQKDARTLTTSYDLAGRVTKRSVPDPNSAGTLDDVTAYDYAGRPRTQTNPNGEVTTYGYGPGNTMTSVTDANGKTTNYTYDYAQRLTQAVEPSNGTASATTNYSYDAAGHLLTRAVVVDANTSLTTSYGYDSVGRLHTQISPRGTCAGCTPANFTTTTDYFLDSTIKKVTDPLTHATSYTYFRNGLEASATDAKNIATSYTYDADNRLATVAVPDTTGTTTAVTKYTYDDAGRLYQVEVPRSTVGTPIKWTYGFDADNRLHTLANPLTKTVTYNYDPDGLPSTLVTARGGAAGTITYTRDAIGRLTSTSYGDGSPTVSYTYDKASRRASMTDAGTGVQNYTYDPDGRVKTIARGSATWTYNYYDNGLLKSTQRPDTTVETWTYDAADRPTQVVSPVGTTTFGFDPNGNLLTSAYPNATTETQTYDNADQLATLTTKKGASTLVGQVITRDNDNLPTQNVVTRGASSETRSYLYDGDNRLKAVCYLVLTSCNTTTNATQAWTYDLDGNRLTEKNGTGTGTTTTNTYDNADRLATTKIGTGTTTTLGYDNDGNILTDGTVTWTYDLNNRIKTSKIGTTTTTWTTDGDGNVLKQVGSATTTYTYDLNHAVPQLATVATSSTSSYRYDPTGRVMTITNGTTNETYSHDPLGAPTDMVSSAGAIVRSYDYAPFGNSRTAVGGPGTPSGPTSTIQYAGMATSGANGTYMTPNRVYNPTSGRFDSVDPITQATGPAWDSPYSYTANQPNAATDRNGTDPSAASDAAATAAADHARNLAALAAFNQQDLTPPVLARFAQWVAPPGSDAEAALLGLTGYGDVVTLGGSHWLRHHVGLGDAIDECSEYYRTGTVVGVAANTAMAIVSLPFAIADIPEIIAGIRTVAALARTGELATAVTNSARAIVTNVRAAASGALRLGDDTGSIDLFARPGGGAATSGVDAVDVAANRVSLRVATRAEIRANAPKTADGDFIDPNTYQVIPKGGPFDYGHKPGYEWWRTQQIAREQGWTRQQLIEYENDASHFQIEDPASNRSHAFEMPR